MSNEKQSPINIRLSQSKIKSTLITFGVGLVVGAIIMAAIWFWIIGPRTTSGALERANERVEQLSGELSELRTEAESLRAEVTDLREQHEQDVREIRGLNRSLEGLTGRLGDITRELRGTESELADARRRIGELTDDARRSSERVSDLRGRVGELEREASRLRSLIGTYRRTVEAAIGGISATDDRIRRALRTISEITEEIDGLVGAD